MMNIKEIYALYEKHPVVTTDSRDCPEDSIFVALKGTSFNGNRFALQALEAGCSYAIVDEMNDGLREGAAALAARRGYAPLIVVDDALQTLKDLAREHRRRFAGPVVGITGTNGKTTTKELIRAVLSAQYRVMATEGNYNNDVGVPKTLFRLNDDYDIGVVEMGASHPGDIKTLVETAEPTCGLITNVGRAHLQGFGSFEGVCRTKGELYDYLLAHDCPLFVNRDNEHLMAMLKERDALSPSPDIYYYGQGDSDDILIKGEVVRCDPFLTFRWREQDSDAGWTSEWMEVKTQLIGAYNIDNMLAAITVGYVNGVPFEDISKALEGYRPTNNRSQLTTTEHNRLVVDAYNANPSSMKAAIDNFKLMMAPRKMVILGQMGELGDVSEEEHRRVVDMLQEAAFDEVWLVGEAFQRVPSPFRTFADTTAVKEALRSERPEGMTILIKGSNSNRLYELTELL